MEKVSRLEEALDAWMKRYNDVYPVRVDLRQRSIGYTIDGYETATV